MDMHLYDLKYMARPISGPANYGQNTGDLRRGPGMFIKSHSLNMSLLHPKAGGVSCSNLGNQVRAPGSKGKTTRTTHEKREIQNIERPRKRGSDRTIHYQGTENDEVEDAVDVSYPVLRLIVPSSVYSVGWSVDRPVSRAGRMARWNWFGGVQNAVFARSVQLPVRMWVVGVGKSRWCCKVTVGVQFVNAFQLIQPIENPQQKKERRRDRHKMKKK